MTQFEQEDQAAYTGQELFELATAISKDLAIQAPLVSLEMQGDQGAQSTLSLQIANDHKVVSIVMVFGSKFTSEVVIGAKVAEITLKTNYKTALDISNRSMSIANALTNGQIRVSGSMKEVVSIANELSLKSR